MKLWADRGNDLLRKAEEGGARIDEDIRQLNPSRVLGREAALTHHRSVNDVGDGNVRDHFAHLSWLSPGGGHFNDTHGLSIAGDGVHGRSNRNVGEAGR